jgi:hypothetical protein
LGGGEEREGLGSRFAMGIVIAQTSQLRAELPYLLIEEGLREGFRSLARLRHE